jgi:ABC-2 type transport system ATP-binding protein
MSSPVLELTKVDLGYDRRVVVSGANLTMGRGQWIGLVGPNASGKTTVLRGAGGRLCPSRGEIRFLGEAIYPVRDRGSAVPACAAAPDELPSFLTVRQSLEIHASAHGLQRVPEASALLCRELGLGAYENELIRHLSLGTRQKLAVVMALQPAPSLLLLDEIFNGLDIRSALKLKVHLRELVERDGMSILLATHALDVVKGYCDGLVLMDSGRLLRSWNAAQLAAFDGTAELEQALAGVLAQTGEG